jgi:hypothetical protein
VAASAAANATVVEVHAASPALARASSSYDLFDRKSAITLVATEHADRLREAMLEVMERALAGGAGEEVARRARQAVSDAIGVEALKLRDALNAMLLPS